MPAREWSEKPVRPRSACWSTCRAPASTGRPTTVGNAHERYAERLSQIGVGSGDLVVSAAGNSAASVAFLLACRAIDAALMPADAGTTRPELMALAERFGAAAMLLPDSLDAERSAVGCGRRHGDRGRAAPVSDPRHRAPLLCRHRGAEADVGIDRRAEGDADERSAADRGRHADRRRRWRSGRRTCKSPRFRCRTRTASAI